MAPSVVIASDSRRSGMRIRQIRRMDLVGGGWRGSHLRARIMQTAGYLRARIWRIQHVDRAGNGQCGCCPYCALECGCVGGRHRSADVCSSQSSALALALKVMPALSRRGHGRDPSVCQIWQSGVARAKGPDSASSGCGGGCRDGGPGDVVGGFEVATTATGCGCIPTPIVSHSHRRGSKVVWQCLEARL